MENAYRSQYSEAGTSNSPAEAVDDDNRHRPDRNLRHYQCGYWSGEQIVENEDIADLMDKAGLQEVLDDAQSQFDQYLTSLE